MTKPAGSFFQERIETMSPDNMPSQQAGARAVGYDAGLRAFFQRVYNTMSGGLVVTGLVAWFTAHSPAMLHMLFGNPVMMFIVVFSPLLFLIFGLSQSRIMQMSVQQATLMFLIYSGLMGLSLSTVFLAYSGASIARVFFISAAMFAGMSGVGYSTKRDLSGMGSFMMMGMFGILIAMLVNMFLHSAAIDFAVSLIGVIAFTGLIAWNTQMLKQTYAAGGGYEANAKLAVAGALQLYLDFINLFMFLLRLLGNRR
jgi:FtsH-binding integral membrane protein